MDSLRHQALRLEALHAQQQQRKLDRWSDSKPELKQLIAALTQSRDLINEDIRNAEAVVNNSQPIQAAPATPSAAARPGSTSHISTLSDAQLISDQASLRDALTRMDRQIVSTQAMLAQTSKEEEREIWQSTLITLQDTRRMHQKEVDAIEVETISRARMQRLKQERAVAEQTGLAQLGRLRQQLVSAEARLNDLKHQLYFPDVKGYSFAFGGRGIFFGGKNILLSELSGAFAIAAEVDSADKQGNFRSARITVQFGGPHLASAQRGTSSQTAVANRAAAVTQSFQLRPSSATQAAAPNRAIASGAPAMTNATAAPPAAPASAATAPSTSTTGSDSRQPPSVNVQQPTDALNGHRQGQNIQQPSTQAEASQAANVPTRQHSNADTASSTAHQSQQHTLNLHQNDVYSPLQASAPQQEAAALDRQTERQMSSSFASTSAGNPVPSYPMYPSSSSASLPPRGPGAVPPEHQSRSKRLATRMLKKLGTKERFRHPQADQSGSGLPASRPAYSPDAFDDSSKKGSKLAQKLLGKSTNSRLVASPIAYGSHVAGRSHKQWSDALNSAGSLGTGHAGTAEVQQDVLEAATEAEAGPETPRTPTTEDLEYDTASTPRHTSDYQGSPGLGAGAVPQEPPLHHLSRNSSFGAQSQAQGPADDDADVYDDNADNARTYSRQGSASGFLPVKEAAAGFKGAFRKVANGITGGEFLEGVTERGSEAGLDSASGSAANRKGLFLVVRLSEVGLIGEKGTKVPNASIAEISVEVELLLTFKFEFTSVQGWHTAVKPTFEVLSLERRAVGASVPLPKTVIRYILSAVLPRVLQRKLLGMLPQELGQYLLDSGQGGRVAGEITIVGPPLSSLDAELAFKQDAGNRAKDARKQAQMNAAAQEARGMLGLTLEQAQVLAELFSGKNGMLANPAPCTISDLQAYYSRLHEEAEVWGPLCQAWESVIHMVCRARGVAPFDYRALMDGHIAHQLLKPVRARLTLNQASVSLNADAIMTAVRDFGERSARETCAKEEASGRKEEGSDPLEVQLQVLETFYTFAAGKLHTFKGKFKQAACSVMAQANARNYALGVEGVSYEGPLRIRLPVKKKLDDEGSFSFEIPLPNPDRQVLLKRFAGGFKQALSSPLTVHQIQSEIAAYMPDTKPAKADEAVSDAESEEEKLPDWGVAKGEKPPLKLGKVIVDGMRVRVRLDQQRIASLLQGITPQAMGSQFADVASGVLSMLGDMAALSFARYHPEDGADPHFVLNMESSHVSNLSAELTQMGFRSGEGVSPGRTLRIVQAISRAVLLTTGRSKQSLKEFDSKFDNWHRHLTKEAMDVAVCLAAECNVQHKSKSEPLMLHIAGTSDDAFGTKPLCVTNELELMSMIRAIKGDAAPSKK